MKHLVIGLGQIGSAVKEILDCDGHDIEILRSGDYDVLHICIPFVDNFVETVENYKKMYNPKLVIIHSTVDIGTCEKLDAVHSPVRGIHPNLKEGIMTFVKYFGGRQAKEASEIFSQLGIPVKVVDDSKSVEALKLWSTTIYGWNIILEKEIHKFCEKNGLDFDLVYTDACKTYNEGYEKLGRPEYKKYILKHADGKIGGHCIIPNCKILAETISRTILDYNNNLQ